jgi:hypothetical protein
VNVVFLTILQLRWLTPGFSKEAQGEICYGAYHHRFLRPIPQDITQQHLEDSYYLSSTTTDQPAADEEDISQVDSIVAKRQLQSGLEFLVKWTGYPFTACTWEPRLVSTM